MENMTRIRGQLYLKSFSLSNALVQKLPKTSLLGFEQENLSRKHVSYFFIYTVKENLPRKTCQGKLASVNEALD